MAVRTCLQALAPTLSTEIKSPLARPRGAFQGAGRYITMKALLFATAAILSAPSALAQDASDLFNKRSLAGAVIGAILDGDASCNKGRSRSEPEPEREREREPRPGRSAYEDQGEIYASYPVEGAPHPCDVDRTSFDCLYERRVETLNARYGGF